MDKLDEKRAAEEEQPIAELENRQDELGALNQANEEKTVDATPGQQDLIGTTDPKSPIIGDEVNNNYII